MWYHWGRSGLPAKNNNVRGTKMGERIIGLIGGTAWPSTVEYYKYINEASGKVLGGDNTAQCLIYSVNLPEYLALAMAGDKDALTEKYVGAANRLVAAGAGLIEICSNTMHMVFDEVEARVSVPMVHIVDATAEKAKSMGITKLGLIGTTVTMQGTFYQDRLLKKHGIETVVPDEEYFAEIMRVIQEELTFYNTSEASLAYYLKAIENMRGKGAQGIILGCTEIPILVKQENTDLPLFDTTSLHAQAAVDWALEG